MLLDSSQEESSPKACLDTPQPNPPVENVAEELSASPNDSGQMASDFMPHNRQEVDDNMAEEDSDRILTDDEYETDDEATSPTANATAEKKAGDKISRCWGNVKYPRIGTCNHEFHIKVHKEGDQYRKVVSHFFGRNKKATASIPNEMFPELCRTCYQRPAYRMKAMGKSAGEGAAATAKLQCDGVIKTLENMQDRIYKDEEGNEWPWWCGFELQLTAEGWQRQHTPEKLAEEVEAKNKLVKDKREGAKKDGKSEKRLHERHMPDAMPNWLVDLCTKDPNQTRQYKNIGTRNGERYSFEDLIRIVKAIKTYCHQNKCALPTVEAIPITIGQLDKDDVLVKKKLRAGTIKHEKSLVGEANKAEQLAKNNPEKNVYGSRAASKRREAVEAGEEVNHSRRSVDLAEIDAKLSEGTIPATRVHEILSKLPGLSKKTVRFELPEELDPVQTMDQTDEILQKGRGRKSGKTKMLIEKIVKKSDNSHTQQLSVTPPPKTDTVSIYRPRLSLSQPAKVDSGKMSNRSSDDEGSDYLLWSPDHSEYDDEDEGEHDEEEYSDEIDFSTQKSSDEISSPESPFPAYKPRRRPAQVQTAVDRASKGAVGVLRTNPFPGNPAPLMSHIAKREQTNTGLKRKGSPEVVETSADNKRHKTAVGGTKTDVEATTTGGSKRKRSLELDETPADTKVRKTIIGGTTRKGKASEPRRRPTRSTRSTAAPSPPDLATVVQQKQQEQGVQKPAPPTHRSPNPNPFPNAPFVSQSKRKAGVRAYLEDAHDLPARVRRALAKAHREELERLRRDLELLE